MKLFRVLWLSAVSLVFADGGWAQPPDQDQPKLHVGSQLRPVHSDSELRFWLENMVLWHRYSLDEAGQVLGLTATEITEHSQRLQLDLKEQPTKDTGQLKILPYPGGRHPRLGFFDGAIQPQRETKVSVFLPWDITSYIVVDVPEAIFSNLGLTYLAHTHIPTVFDQSNQQLEPLEWKQHPDGRLSSHRVLPNQIEFGAEVVAAADHVRMELWLKNGTEQELTGLRVQNCVMLGRAAGFEGQSNDNKILRDPYALARSAEGDRWIITAWTPLHRCWANPPCPCLHSDPIFPNCPPGETVRVQGWLSFYEGTDWESELKRIESLQWWDDKD